MKGLILTDSDLRIGTRKELVKAQLERLLFIPLNELIGKLQYGSRLPEVLNGLHDDSLVSNVVNEIEFLVQTSMPTIYINSIEVEFENNVIYTMIIKIEYTYINDNTDDDVILINLLSKEI